MNDPGESGPPTTAARAPHAAAPGTGPRAASGRRSALRRYPALVWLVAAGLLALLLPSGLTLPQSGPSTLAEYAPVPGAGEGSADLGELAATESGGIGSGTGKGERAGAAEQDPERRGTSGRFARKAGTKRCVGDPPRQTEDPLSPPCIAFFEGDNFGSTAQGVTADEVIVMVVTEEVTTDPNKGDVVDCADEPRPDEPLQDAVCKAYMRFFNDRYQTYERQVHLYSVHAVKEQDLYDKYKPFAHVRFNIPTSAAARLGMFSVGAVSIYRDVYLKEAPRMASFRPDYEDMTAMASSFICSKLAGRPARYAGDPSLQTATRKFAYWLKDGKGPDRYEQLVLDGLQSRCGVDITLFGGGTTDSSGAARLKAQGVTTVLTNVVSTALAAVTGYASQAAWFPEWVVPANQDPSGIDVNFSARFARAEQWRNAFGLTVDYRRSRLEEQSWYRAYREGCDSCPEPQFGNTGARSAALAYDALAMLFYGIQAAGPRLTIDNVDRGMHAIPPRASNDPFAPAAYFGPGNYTFIKDAMAIWWDPSGAPPGSPSPGCYRLPGEGRRYRADEWPVGDDDIKRAGPCQGDTFRG